MPSRSDLEQILRAQNAIYRAKRGSVDGGLHRTPLVGYAGTYLDREGESKHYVGETYFDFAMVEQDPSSLFQFATAFGDRWNRMADVILGMPIGGMALALFIADCNCCHYAVAEKRVTALATETSREESELVLNRYIIPSGAKVVIVEDVANNFSTTAKGVDLVRSMGSEVIALACAINRSPGLQRDWNGVPVVSALDIEMPQWRQDDEYVLADIEAGNVIWKPKNAWERLLNWPLNELPGA